VCAPGHYGPAKKLSDLENSPSGLFFKPSYKALPPGHMPVGTITDNYLPRHPPLMKPLFLESNDILPRGEQYITGAALDHHAGNGG